jgi:hypothetical protein
MRRRAPALLALAAAIGLTGCQSPPPNRPRILSVQTPAGMPAPPPLNTTRTRPLQVPGAPVRPSTPVAVPVAPVGAAVEAPLLPPPGATPPPAQYVPQVQGAAVPVVPAVPVAPASNPPMQATVRSESMLKEPKPLPPVGDNPNQ